MDIQIKFDNEYVAQTPTFALCTRGGKYIGAIPATDITVKPNWNAQSDLVFTVNEYDNGVRYQYWDYLKDFKVIWCKEWNACFEITVDIQENPSRSKSVTCTSLGEAELSQINIDGLECNTEDDIARDDYEPTVLFSTENTKASLLHRMLEKAPHYSVEHVDESIANIQRQFSFDGTNIYDALQQVATEINCIFIFNNGRADDGSIKRTISAYDLESYCLDCHKRGDFDDACPECSSTNIQRGYGDDTTIYVSTDNLADGITYTTDVDSVKNCFRLEAGDDLMTAAVISCNPNGTRYIWHISDEMKEDMSSELVSKLESYDALYQEYQTTKQIDLDADVVSKYNNLVNKYNSDDFSISSVSSPLVGYSALMNAYYDTIDFDLYLEHVMMPSPTLPSTTASEQANKLTSANIPTAAVMNLDSCSAATASSSVLSMAKVIVDSRYQVKVNSSSFESNVWTGSFTVTNYSNEEDTATCAEFSVTITDEYEAYVKQKIDMSLNKTEVGATDVVAIFKLDEAEFQTEIEKYCVASLTSFYDACSACLDILIQQGAGDPDSDLYAKLYEPYYQKGQLLESEISLRESEIALVVGNYDADNVLLEEGMQSLLMRLQADIQKELNFQSYVGEDLWLELASYRREDTYSNSNYISDGLDNAQLFTNAREFFEVANKEIIKSSTLQHSITADLQNLLVMEDFQPIVKYFKLGNWIHICVNNQVYKLRLIGYEVNFSDLQHISVTFSDVKITSSGISDVKSVLDQATSMATSYGSVSRQAGQGAKSNAKLNTWINDGFATTNMKIVNNAENQDIVWGESGIVCREKLPFVDEYDPRQTKIINQGLFVTDDDWKTCKAGVGRYYYYDPTTGNLTEAYGVIADTVVSNLTLSKNVGIYNEDGSIELNNKGFTLTTNDVDSETKNVFTIQKEVKDTDGTTTTVPLLYVNDDGELVLNGSIQVVSSSGSSSSLEDTNNKVDEISSSKMYRVETQVTGSTIFNERDQQSTIECRVYSWDTDITPTLDSSQFIWHRHSSDEASDAEWDSYHIGMKSITVTTEDVYNNASFDCEVTIE